MVFSHWSFQHLWLKFCFVIMTIDWWSINYHNSDHHGHCHPAAWEFQVRNSKDPVAVLLEVYIEANRWGGSFMHLLDTICLACLISMAISCPLYALQKVGSWRWRICWWSEAGICQVGGGTPTKSSRLENLQVLFEFELIGFVILFIKPGESKTLWCSNHCPHQGDVGWVSGGGLQEAWHQVWSFRWRVHVWGAGQWSSNHHIS